MTASALNHDCRLGRVCAKVHLEPKLHAFDGCFAGKIRMGDIDAAVERRGFVLFMEWKKGGNVENFAQVSLHQALTRHTRNISVFVVGNPETMEVERIRVMTRGEWRGEWEPCTLEQLQARFTGWFSWADAGGRADRRRA
jgi:hypothetical protein